MRRYTSHNQKVLWIQIDHITSSSSSRRSTVCSRLHWLGITPWMRSSSRSGSSPLKQTHASTRSTTTVPTVTVIPDHMTPNYIKHLCTPQPMENHRSSCQSTSMIFLSLACLQMLRQSRSNYKIISTSRTSDPSPPSSVSMSFTTQLLALLTSHRNRRSWISQLNFNSSAPSCWDVHFPLAPIFTLSSLHQAHMLISSFIDLSVPSCTSPLQPDLMFFMQSSISLVLCECSTTPISKPHDMFYDTSTGPSSRQSTTTKMTTLTFPSSTATQATAPTR